MLPLHVLASISAADKIISHFKWPRKPMENQQVVPLPSNNSLLSRSQPTQVPCTYERIQSPIYLQNVSIHHRKKRNCVTQSHGCRPKAEDFVITQNTFRRPQRTNSQTSPLSCGTFFTEYPATRRDSESITRVSDSEICREMSRIYQKTGLIYLKKYYFIFLLSVNYKTNV